MMTRTTTKVRARLEDERTRLMEVLEQLTGGRSQGDWTGTLSQPGDLADRASTRSSQDDVESLIATMRHRLDQVDGAMARLEDGTYGVCEICGEQIAAARLEALPFTTVCLEDADAPIRRIPG